MNQIKSNAEIYSPGSIKKGGNPQELARVLSVPQTIGLVLSDITPTASLFVIAASVFPIAGTGTLWTFLIAGLIAICVALSMAELGSTYPIAGGMYSIVARVLGKPLGFITMFDYVVQGIFLPASIALGIGNYLTLIFPNVNANIWATILMLAVTAVAFFSVKTSANITGFFLIIELIVLTIIIVLGFANPHNSVSTLLIPKLFSSSGSSSVPIGAIAATIAVALFSFNGYDSAINFSEETNSSAKNVGRSVLTAAILGVTFQLVAVIAMLVGTKSLGGFFTAKLPVYDFLESYLGTTVTKVLTVGVILAVVNGTLAIVLQFSRFLYSTARDQSWPGPVNRVFSNIHPRFKTPWASVLFVGLTGSLLTLFGSLVSAITFTSVLIVVVYAFIAVAAIVNRFKINKKDIPFKMWLWPIPSIIALIGSVFALSRQSVSDLIICGILFAVGLGYYFIASRKGTGLWQH